MEFELAGRQVRGLRVIDEPAPDLHRPAIGVNLGQPLGMVADQFRGLGVFLPRLRRSRPAEGERSLRLLELLVVDERVLGPVQLIEDLSDIEVGRGDIDPSHRGLPGSALINSSLSAAPC